MCTGGAWFRRGTATRGMGLGMQGSGAGARLTFALAADPHVPAAVLDVDPAVHVPLRLVVVVNQAAIQIEDKPVPLPAAQDGACWDREQVKDSSEPSGTHSTLTRPDLIPQTWIPPAPVRRCIPQDTCAWHKHPGQRDQVALNGKRLPKKPSGRWVLPCRAHGSGSSAGHGAVSVLIAGSPSLRLRKSATISLLPWITRPGRGSLCPPHPTTSSQQPSLGFLGDSQPGEWHLLCRQSQPLFTSAMAAAGFGGSAGTGRIMGLK